MTREEFIEITEAICPRCKAGALIRKRTDTGEWVHDGRGPNPNQQTHAYCWASGFRNSRFAEVMKDG